MSVIPFLPNFVPYDEIPDDFKVEKGIRVIYYYENEHYETNIDYNPLWNAFIDNHDPETLIGRIANFNREEETVNVDWENDLNVYNISELLYEIKTKKIELKAKEL